MKKKYKLIAIIIVAFVIISTISIKIGTDFYQERKLKTEIKEIIKYFEKESYNNEELNKILNRTIIKKGNYNKVEISVKNYYKDLQADLSNLDFLLSKDNFSFYLSENNLLEDRPSFIKSKDNLSNTESQITEIYQELINQLEDKTTIISYVADKDVNSYYKDFYYSLIKDYITEDFKLNLNNKKEDTLANINTYNKIFDYLIANKGKWSIEKDKIVFKNNLYYEEYNNIVKELKEVKNN